MNQRERLGIRVSKEDKEEWRRKAAAQGMSLSKWIKTILNNS